MRFDELKLNSCTKTMPADCSRGFIEARFAHKPRCKRCILRLLRSVLLALNSHMHGRTHVRNAMWRSPNFLSSHTNPQVIQLCSQVTPPIAYESTSRSPSSFVC